MQIPNEGWVLQGKVAHGREKNNLMLENRFETKTAVFARDADIEMAYAVEIYLVIDI